MLLIYRPIWRQGFNKFWRDYYFCCNYSYIQSQEWTSFSDDSFCDRQVSLFFLLILPWERGISESTITVQGSDFRPSTVCVLKACLPFGDWLLLLTSLGLCVDFHLQETWLPIFLAFWFLLPVKILFTLVVFPYFLVSSTMYSKHVCYKLSSRSYFVLDCFPPVYLFTHRQKNKPPTFIILLNPSSSSICSPQSNQNKIFYNVKQIKLCID